MILNNIDKISSSTLCVLVALNQVFNMNKDLLTTAMNELSLRSAMGEIFNFEDEIEKKCIEFRSTEADQSAIFD